MEVLNDLVLGAAERRARELRRRRADRAAVTVSIGLTVVLVLIAIFYEAKAGEVLIGLNYNHLSQLDAGPPFNDRDEDAVDHVGLHLLGRGALAPGWELFAGISAGRNYNMTGCDRCWNDGDAKIDTLFFMGIQKQIYKW